MSGSFPNLPEPAPTFAPCAAFRIAMRGTPQNGSKRQRTPFHERVTTADFGGQKARNRLGRSPASVRPGYSSGSRCSKAVMIGPKQART
jgi:hypothetical protein